MQHINLRSRPKIILITHSDNANSVHTSVSGRRWGDGLWI